MEQPQGAGNLVELTAAIRESLAPVRQHLETIEAAIAEKEAELAGLKDARRIALAVIRASDPTMAGPGRTNARKGVPRGVRSQTVGAEYVEAVRAYLVANMTPDQDLIASDLFRDEAFAEATGGAGRPQKVSRAFHVLQDEGVIRLDRIQGNAKVFRLNRGTDNER